MFSAYHGPDSVFAQAAPRVLYPRHKPSRLFRCIRSHKNGGSLEATSLSTHEWRLHADSFVEPDV